jgi:hypothetical protein
MITKITRELPLGIGEYDERGGYLHLKKPITLYPKPYNELVKAKGIDENGYVYTSTFTTAEMDDLYRRGVLWKYPY